ncbi:hypothetical protein KP509_10G079900 [Ceratopteris richardii]|uniref:Uncharacterized protein n=1 Tax=Ceratopteris richardii TaxID=49495 RepID=A0A8T2TWT9_CERRI|nr:hypothetical protein KP509_10G079900 [Ceratopteris richardii]
MHTHIYIMNAHFHTLLLMLTRPFVNFKEDTHQPHSFPCPHAISSYFFSTSHLLFIMSHASLCNHTYEPCHIPCSRPYPYTYTLFTYPFPNIESSKPCLHSLNRSPHTLLTLHGTLSFGPLPVFLHYSSKHNPTITKKTYHV